MLEKKIINSSRKAGKNCDEKNNLTYHLNIHKFIYHIWWHQKDYFNLLDGIS